MRAVLVALGVFHLSLGLLALLAPGTFFDEIGRYGAENLHYVGDVGAFTAGLRPRPAGRGRRPSWWAPMLWLGAIWYALHAPTMPSTPTRPAATPGAGWTRG